MIASTAATPGAGAATTPPRCVASMFRAKCAATRDAAAVAPPYFAVSINDHCRLQIMIEVVLQDARRARWLRMHQPWRVFDVRTVADIDPTLRQIEQLVTDRRCYAAGFISYEGG